LCYLFPGQRQLEKVRFFDEALYKLRFTIERTFAWKGKFKRLLLRFEAKQIRHLGFKLTASTLINPVVVKIVVAFLFI
jgi:transposase